MTVEAFTGPDNKSGRATGDGGYSVFTLSGRGGDVAGVETLVEVCVADALARDVPRPGQGWHQRQHQGQG